eukprot:scaffold115_cov304-Prasinococcus_capsulatus_cf.AAC.7
MPRYPSASRVRTLRSSSESLDTSNAGLDLEAAGLACAGVRAVVFPLTTPLSFATEPLLTPSGRPLDTGAAAVRLTAEG